MNQNKKYNGVIISILSEIKRTARHPLATDAGVLTVSQYIGAGFGLLTTIMAARLLGPTDYGLAALVMSYPNLLLSFFSIKSVSVTTRYIAGFRATGQIENLRSICKLGYSLDFAAALIALALIGGTSWWVTHHILNIPNLTWLVVVYAASFPLSSLTGMSLAVLSSWGRFRLLASFQVIERVIILFLVAGLLVAGLGVSGLVLGTAVGHAIMGIVMMITTTYILRMEGIGSWWKAPLAKIVSLRRELASFFGWNYLMVTLTGLIAQVPLMLLGRLRSPEEAGYYRLATTLMTTGSYFESSMGRVVYPMFSARWSRGESFKNSLRRWTLRGGIPLGVFLLLAIPFFPLLIPAVLGQGYSPMIQGAQVMMVAAAVSTVFFWLTPFYYATGEIGLWTKAYGFYAIFILGLGWICIQHWGFIGLAGLLVAGKIVFVLLMVAFAIRKDEKDESVHCTTQR